jgi:hypothetical protein
MQPDSSDREFINTAGKTIAKCVLYICLASTAITWVMSRQLDSNTIDQCKTACGTHIGIKEITATSCECNNHQEITQSPWVLPK